MKRTILIVLPVFVLVIAAIAAVVYFKVVPLPGAKPVATPAPQPALVDYTLPEKVVNLADSPTYHYLKIQVTLEFADPTHRQSQLTGDVLTQREADYSQMVAPYLPAMNDFLITTLTGKTSADLLTEAGKEKLRTELLDGLQRIVPAPVLKTIYFTDFVIQ